MSIECNQHVRALLESFRDGYDCDTDAHKYGTCCRCCAAAAALAGEHWEDWYRAGYLDPSTGEKTRAVQPKETS